MSSLRHITPVRVLIAGALVFAGVEIVKLARERPVAVAVRVACSSDRRDAIRVLFVGNSHTFVNDLPGALCGLGAASTPPVPLDVTEAVAGGYSLADHLRDGTAARLIDEGRWDWVVLQEQSLQPTMASGRFMASLRRLDERIRAVHARTALFALPPRLDWHQDTQVVQRAYISAAAEVGATLVPVGAAWSSALAERPRLDLYQADGYHPRPAGTYLGACVFYATLTGKSPEGLPPRAGSIALAPDLALELQHAARLAAGK